MAADSTRAGRSIRQAAGYRAFVPAPLPPRPPLNLDRPLVRILSRADQGIGRLDGIGATVPDPNRFVAMFVRREAVLSSQAGKPCSARRSREPAARSTTCSPSRPTRPPENRSAGRAIGRVGLRRSVRRGWNGRSSPLLTRFAPSVAHRSVTGRRAGTRYTLRPPLARM